MTVFEHLLVEIENLKEVNQALQNENYNLELNLSHIEESVRKETAREILNDVWEKTLFQNGLFFIDEVCELKKKYEVEE